MGRAELQIAGRQEQRDQGGKEQRDEQQATGRARRFRVGDVFWRHGVRVCQGGFG